MSAIVAFLSIAVMASEPPAAPDDPAAALGRARVCWAALDPDCAEGALLIARAGVAALEPDAQRETWWLSAEVALSMERPADAERWLVELLTLDPRFAPSAWPAPWTAVLERARKVAPDRLPPTITVVAPAESPPKKPIAIEVRADDPSGVARCELVVGELRTTLLAADGLRFRGEIPKERVKVPELAFHVEALDRAGNLSRWPESGEARVLVVAPPPPPPITQRWWFWTAVGAVAVGGVAALVWALGGDDDPIARDRLGDIAIDTEVSR